MSDFDEIISEFLVECFEGLDQLDGEFVALEVRPDDQETLSSIFRTIHSIKGASGFLEFHRLEKLTHAGENLLDALRSSEIAMREEIASALLELNDAVRQMLGVIETTGSDEGADDPSFEELRQRLEQLLAEGNARPRRPTRSPTPRRARRLRRSRSRTRRAASESAAETRSHEEEGGSQEGDRQEGRRQVHHAEEGGGSGGVVRGGR